MDRKWKVVRDDYGDGYWLETVPESDDRKWFGTRTEAAWVCRNLMDASPVGRGLESAKDA